MTAANSTLQINDDQPSGRKLFFNFASEFLGVRVFAIQNGFGIVEDQLLFQDAIGSTRAVPHTILLLEQDAAQEIIRKKLARTNAD